MSQPTTPEQKVWVELTRGEVHAAREWLGSTTIEAFRPLTDVDASADAKLLAALSNPQEQGAGLTREDGERLYKIAARLDACVEAGAFRDGSQFAHDVSYLRQLSQRILSQPVQDDVERLREKLLGDETRDRLADLLREEGWYVTDFRMRNLFDLLARAVIAAPDVERLGGEEGPCATADCNQPANMTIEVPDTGEKAAYCYRCAAAILADHLTATTKQPEAPPLEHSKDEADAFRELGKRLLGEGVDRVAKRQYAAAQHPYYDEGDWEAMTEKERLRWSDPLREQIAAVWNEATGHVDFPLVPAPEHSKGGLELDPRRRGVLREAMVLAFVEGVTLAGGLFRIEPEDYPKDSAVVERVLRSAQSSVADLYPALAALADRLGQDPQPNQGSDQPKDCGGSTVAEIERAEDEACTCTDDLPHDGPFGEYTTAGCPIHGKPDQPKPRCLHTVFDPIQPGASKEDR